MSAKLIFVVGAAAAAIGCAVLAGLIVAVVGLSARVPEATLVTVTAESAAAVFGGVIALSGIAASLFFKASEPTTPDNPVISPAGRRSDPGGAHDAGSDRSRQDGELRAAVEARALLLKAARTELREQAGSGQPARGRRRYNPAGKAKLTRWGSGAGAL